MVAIVHMEEFKAARRGSRGFVSLPCPLCDSETVACDRGEKVAYVCHGADKGHDRFEWSHDPRHVEVAA